MEPDTALVVAMSACAVVLLFQLLDFGYGRDQSIFALVGRTIRDGGLPYRDAWDFKPPGIYFLYALAGPATWGIRVLEALSMAAMAVAFVALSRRCSAGWGAGLVGAILALDTHVRLEFWHTAQPESFGAALIACGLAFAANALRERPASPAAASWLVVVRRRAIVWRSGYAEADHRRGRGGFRGRTRRRHISTLWPFFWPPVDRMSRPVLGWRITSPPRVRGLFLDPGGLGRLARRYGVYSSILPGSHGLTQADSICSRR